MFRARCRPASTSCRCAGTLRAPLRSGRPAPTSKSHHPLVHLQLLLHRRPRRRKLLLGRAGSAPATPAHPRKPTASGTATGAVTRTRTVAMEHGLSASARRRRRRRHQWWRRRRRIHLRHQTLGQSSAAFATASTCASRKWREQGQSRALSKKLSSILASRCVETFITTADGWAHSGEHAQRTPKQTFL